MSYQLHKVKGDQHTDRRTDGRTVRHVQHNMPSFSKGGIKFDKYGKNISVQHFDPAPPQGHVTLVKWEKLIDEPTVQDHPPNFLKILHFVCKQNRITNKQMDGQTDERSDYNR